MRHISIFKRMGAIGVLLFATASALALPALAQDYTTPDAPYMDEQAQVQTQTGGQADIDLDELDALLPPHLRTPLPLREKNAVQTSTARNGKSVQTKAESGDSGQVAPSAIENFFRELSGDTTLAQFGYSFFENAGQETPAPSTSGLVQDDYILGAGDRLAVSFLGERKDKRTYTIDQSGTLEIDLLPPLAATGKTLGELRTDIRHMLDMQAYHGDVYITLEGVRQLSVLVAGHVAKPGRQSLGALQTAMEALEGAGGVLKTGSLRQIRLVRAGKTLPIDLYDIIGGKFSASTLPTLHDGDRIIVPPLGPTIAVAGDVRQPAIYELPLEGTLNGEEALALAGGLLATGQNRIMLTQPQNNGQRSAQVLGAVATQTIGDGAVLSVVRTQDLQAATFTLAGETRSAGSFPVAQFPRLSKILRQPQSFGDDIYPLMGVVSRRMKQDLGRDLIAFSPQDIFTGHADMPLEDSDIVTLLSRGDIQAALNEKTADSKLDPLVVTFIREHAVSLQGAVRLPGQWPVAGPVAVTKILDVAGGTLKDADLTRTEISRNDIGLPETTQGAVSHRDTVNLADISATEITVTFGDAVRVPDRFEAVTRQAVTLYGEVRNPGTYDLMRGDTLLTLIDRAGGLTDQGYPMGTVFSRASERRREKDKYDAAARDLERAIAAAKEENAGKIDMAQLAMARELIGEMKSIEPVGRITVESDPAILRRDPAQDILLESGDKIYIPKRPLSVRVTGEVLSPAALQFRADKKSSDYISEAGGLTKYADTGRIFVLNPDGSAQPLSASSWTRFKPVMITPGATIVVPHDPKPFDFMESAKDITQILSNLAVSSIYAEDLVDRN